MRFHQAIQFLPLETVRALTLASDQLGYDGVYLSDHLFNPRVLESKYTYSTAPDGAPFWEKETEWPDPMCLVSSLAAVRPPTSPSPPASTSPPSVTSSPWPSRWAPPPCCPTTGSASASGSAGARRSTSRPARTSTTGASASTT